MPPGCLQLEMQLVRRERRIAAKPFRIGQAARRAALDEPRTRRIRRLVPDAAHDWVGRMPRQFLRRAILMQDRARDVRRRQPGVLCHLRHPRAFGDEIVLVPFAFHRHGADDVVTAGNAAIVRRQEVTPDGGIVPVAKRDHGLVAQPRMRVVRQIPEMMMRIDNGQIGITRHGPSPLVDQRGRRQARYAWMGRLMRPGEGKTQPTRSAACALRDRCRPASTKPPQ